MSSGDFTTYVRGKQQERDGPNQKFMVDGFTRWAESDGPSRVGGAERMGDEHVSRERRSHIRGGCDSLYGGGRPVGGRRAARNQFLRSRSVSSSDSSDSSSTGDSSSSSSSDGSSQSSSGSSSRSSSRSSRSSSGSSSCSGMGRRRGGFSWGSLASLAKTAVQNGPAAVSAAKDLYGAYKSMTGKGRRHRGGKSRRRRGGFSFSSLVSLAKKGVELAKEHGPEALALAKQAHEALKGKGGPVEMMDRKSRAYWRANSEGQRGRGRRSESCSSGGSWSSFLSSAASTAKELAPVALDAYKAYSASKKGKGRRRRSSSSSSGGSWSSFLSSAASTAKDLAPVALDAYKAYSASKKGKGSRHAEYVRQHRRRHPQPQRGHGFADGLLMQLKDQIGMAQQKGDQATVDALKQKYEEIQKDMAMNPFMGHGHHHGGLAPRHPTQQVPPPHALGHPVGHGRMGGVTPMSETDFRAKLAELRIPFGEKQMEDMYAQYSSRAQQNLGAGWLSDLAKTAVKAAPSVISAVKTAAPLAKDALAAYQAATKKPVAGKGRKGARAPSERNKLVSKVMKENPGMKLGEASKRVSEMMKRGGNL